MRLFEAFGEIVLRGQEQVAEALGDVESNAASSAESLDTVSDSAGTTGDALVDAGDRAESLADSLGETNNALEDTEGALDSASSGANSFFESLGNLGEGIGNTGETLTKWVSGPVAGVAAALTALTFSFIETGDSIAKNSQIVGLSTDTYQELHFAIGQISKASAGEIDMAFARMSSAIGDATLGNKAAIESLERLGFTQKQIASGTITTEQAFANFTSRLRAMKTDAEATAFATDYFGGKIGKVLGPTLRNNSGAIDELRGTFKELGLGMSEDGTKAAEAVGDQLDILTRQFKAVGMEIAVNVMPVIIQVMTWLQNNAVPVVKTLGSALAGLFEAFNMLPEPMQNVIGMAVAIAAVLGPVLVIVGKIVSVFGTVGTAITGLIGSSTMLMGVITAIAPAFGALIGILGPAILIFAALMAAVYAVIAVIENWDAIVKATTETIQVFSDFILETFNKIAAFVTEWGTKIINFYIGMWKAIIDGVMQFGTMLVQGFSSMFTAAWDTVKGFGESILNFFRELPSVVMQYVMQMAQNVVDAVTQMVNRTVQALKDMYNKVVGNSIIPDMVAEVGQEMHKMSSQGISEAERFNKGVQGNLESIESPQLGINSGAGSGNGSNGNTGGNTYIDMSHAVFKDDKDMTDRLIRNGQVLAGAF